MQTSTNDIINFLSNNTDLCMAITSVCALIVSIIALFVAIYTARFQNKSQQDNVMPICRISIGDYEDDIFVSLKNIGSGALKIKEVKCINHATHEEGPILYLMLPSVDQNWQDYMGDMRGMYLGIQEEQYLIKIIPETEDVKNELRKTLKDMEIIVTYESIYRKEFICSRKLDFFGRLLD